jgi:coproporphyrinogen III oxidase-like Fe-S oxidoreductase
MTQEELKRSILEVLYRHQTTMKTPVSRLSLQRAFEIRSNELDPLLEELDKKGYLKLQGEAVSLSEHGFLILNSREYSYCPHL